MVIQQNSRKLLVMDILMSETCLAHKKWNKIASDIKLVFYSSTVLQESVYFDSKAEDEIPESNQVLKVRVVHMSH